jgi:biopolymer transport protein ExbD
LHSCPNQIAVSADRIKAAGLGVGRKAVIQPPLTSRRISMAMSLPGEGAGDAGDPLMDINTTPLIDVMLVLLILFIITLPVMTHAVKLDTPRTDAPPPPPDAVKPEIISLNIDFDGTIFWNGSPIDVSQLDSYLLRERSKDPQPEIHIRPDKLAKYENVAKVLASSQRLGMKKIGFIGNEQFIE